MRLGSWLLVVLRLRLGLRMDRLGLRCWGLVLLRGRLRLVLGVSLLGLRLILRLRLILGLRLLDRPLLCLVLRLRLLGRGLVLRLGRLWLRCWLGNRDLVGLAGVAVPLGILLYIAQRVRTSRTFAHIFISKQFYSK